MPRSELVAVIPLVWRASVGAKVGIVRSPFGGVIVMVARSGVRPGFMPAPCRFITVAEFLRRALTVGVIAGREDRTFDVVKQGGGCFGPAGPADQSSPALRNVTSPD